MRIYADNRKNISPNVGAITDSGRKKSNQIKPNQTSFFIFSAIEVASRMKPEDFLSPFRVFPPRMRRYDEYNNDPGNGRQ
jgi:hypothetical protein